jgi:hypothetical protein
MRRWPVRLLMNVAVYFVFGGGLFAFAGMQTNRGATFQEVALTSTFVALWCGVLTTIIEVWVKQLGDTRKRIAIAAVLGALSLGGFSGALSLIAFRSVQPTFVLVGALFGGLMQAARAFSTASMKHDSEDETRD